MQKIWLLVPIVALYAGWVLRLPGQPASAADGPRFTGDRLERPGDYREWVWLSSGVGMSYGPTSKADPSAEAPFDNVFVTPAAYRAFLRTGTWPDQTMLVLEQRVSESRGSINQQGHYQGEFRAMEVELKDQRRFAGGWAFFSFERGASSASPIPRSAPCYSCHAQHGAVDNTFVQFYPTLVEIARQKGTLKPAAEAR